MTDRGAEPILLGIDAGTSEVKVCAYARSGRLLASAGRSILITSPRPSRAETDVETYWLKMTEAVREATRNLPSVASVGVVSTCPATIPLDEALNPLGNGILYLDNRSEGLIREKFREGGEDEFFARAGNRPGCSSSWLANIGWFRRNAPEVWKKTRHVALLCGFLVARMTGRLTMDWTQASYSGGFRMDEPDLGWDDGLLDFWEADRLLLPETGWSCLPAGTLRAEAAESMGIAPGATVAFGSADTAAAAFAIGVAEAGEAFESAGTSGVITFCLDSPRFEDSFMNRCHIVPGRWLAHGGMSTLGGAFGWLRSKIFPGLESVDELERLAEESRPGANGLVFLPYLAGERSPIWDASASGVWLGLRLDHTRADMVRAVFEGTAFGLKQILERGKRFWGCDPERLPGVGGGARSKLWAAIKADVLGLDYAVARDPAAAAWGAALLGGIAGGIFSGTDDRNIAFIQSSGAESSGASGSDPDTAERKAAYEKMYVVYERIYPALKPIMHELAGNIANAAK